MSAISSLLEPVGRCDFSPVALRENHGIAFLGVKPYGEGFVVSVEEARAWIEEDAANSEVLSPYLNGQDVNSNANLGPSRWVIDFGDMTEEAASKFSAPFARIHETVRLERLSNNSKSRRERWWQFADRSVGMRSAVAELGSVIVIAQTSKTLMPVCVPNDCVFDQKLVVFSSDRPGFLAALSSSIHQAWVTQRGSTRTADPVYTPKSTFETFPFPVINEGLDLAGSQLANVRHEIMSRRDLGLTRLYNLVNNPDVVDDPDMARMRELHVQVDEAMVAAYGWSHVELGHGFHTYRQARRWAIGPSARVEWMDRLLEENQRRAAEEAKVSAPSGTKGTAKRKRAVVADQEAMFDV